MPASNLTAEELRELLLSFVGSLTLCDHMGDVADDVNLVLERLGMQVSWGEWSDLGRQLAKQGVKTLYGTRLDGEDDDGEET